MKPAYHFDRRHLLRRRCCCGVVGNTLPQVWPSSSVAANAPPGFGKAKSVLIVLLSGGPSQLDMWDPKPEGPTDIRGEFSTIPTTISGVRVGETLTQVCG